VTATRPLLKQRRPLLQANSQKSPSIDFMADAMLEEASDTQQCLDHLARTE